MYLNNKTGKLVCNACREEYIGNHLCEQVSDRLHAFLGRFSKLTIVGGPTEFNSRGYLPQLRIAVEGNFGTEICLQLMNPDNNAILGSMLKINPEDFGKEEQPLEAVTKHIAKYVQDCFFQASTLPMKERTPKFSELHPEFKGSFMSELLDGSIALQCQEHKRDFTKIKYEYSELISKKFNVNFFFYCPDCSTCSAMLGITKDINQCASFTDMISITQFSINRQYKDRGKL